MEKAAPEVYCASNGQCSPKKENSRILVDLLPSLANGQAPTQGPKSPIETRIKLEDDTGEEADMRSSVPEEVDQNQGDESGLEDPMADSPSNLQDGASGPDGTSDTGARLPNGDRPFQCNQCGVSFTQKGNLLRHIKLHTGEKPFKCPFCNYACRRRDALTGHLRTHAVGKPHKCNYCGRSYKQRTSLEEHKERCHSFLQSTDPLANAGPYSGEVAKESRAMAEPSAMASFDRPPIIERLQSTVGKRKSTNPQKFVGEKVMRYSYPELGYDMGMKYEKEAELMQAHMMDQAISNAISYLGSDSLRPMGHHGGPPLSMADVVPMVNPLFHHHFPPMSHRMERTGGRDVALQQPPLLPLLPPPPPPPPTFSNGPSPLVRSSQGGQGGQREDSPNNSGLDSADSARSSPQEKAGHQGNQPRPRPRSPREHSPTEPPPVADRPLSRDVVRVFGRGGREVRAFQCDHCRVLFLDHVMYTIHMGCHGYRDPLECNICGHRSQDRYEFSSHIVRGEHTLQ